MGDTKAELSAVMRGRVEGRFSSSLIMTFLIVSVYLPEDTGEDSEVCHRQALHFLAKAEYSAALALVERARMAYLDNRQEMREMLESYFERTFYYSHQGDGGRGHELHQHRQHPGRVPPQAWGLCHVQKVCRAGLHQIWRNDKWSLIRKLTPICQVLMRTQSSDAQLVKAEAEYNLCHFEHALVTYYKGEEK